MSLPRWRPGLALLDGAMGTALLSRGLPPSSLPERWVLERPWEVARVHAGHAAAGARVLLTCTFNLARAADEDLPAGVGTVALGAVHLARSTRCGVVAGCVGATGLARPDGSGPSAAELGERFDRAFRALAQGGVDLLWTESHLTLREARAALAAGRATGLPVVATAFLVPAPGGLVALDGTPGEELLEALWRDGASAVGVNCVEPGGALTALVARVVSRAPVPIVAKGSGGLPGALRSPDDFAAGMARAVVAGASLVGGCCGTGPDHLRSLGRAVARERRPQALG